MSNTTPELSTRQINQAREQAQYTRNKILKAFADGNLTTWHQIESVYGITLQSLLPPGIEATDKLRQQKPIGWQLDELLCNFIKGTEARLKADLLATQEDLPKLRFKLTPEPECYRFRNPRIPDLHLFPEQDPVFNCIYNTFFNKQLLEPSQPPPRALLQNGKTGSGKTMVANAVIDKFIAEGRHNPPQDFPIPCPYPVLWITYTNAVEQTIRSLEDAGLGAEINKTIHVIAYSDLMTRHGQARFVERIEEPDEFNPENPPLVTWKWRPSAIPRLLVLDEAHSVQNEDAVRFEIIKSLDLTERSLLNPLTNKPFFDMKVLFLTATPIERVTDLRMFVCMTDLNFQGNRITYDNFNTLFANVIANGNPDKVTKAATKRTWEVLRHRIIELPRTKWKHKAVNMVKLYKFETEADRDQYHKAWEEHVERCRKLGKDADAGAEYTSLMIFANKVEPIRARQIVREMFENVQAGKTSVMATRFTGTIIRAAFELCDTYNVPRSEMSIIWGGRKNIEPERILTEADFGEIMRAANENGGYIPPETIRLIKRNLAWQEDRLLFQDASDSLQDARYQRLKDWGLIGVQTKLKRQAEIDKFMSGQARYCFFTADSGGTGLSLEHKSPLTAPRVLWATPIYNGKQFTQVMGRCPRRVSISDTLQYICLMSGTIEEEHVAPILDNKLQSAGEFSSAKDDIAMALASKKIRATTFRELDKLGVHLRTKAEAEALAATTDNQIYDSTSSTDDDNDND